MRIDEKAGGALLSAAAWASAVGPDAQSLTDAALICQEYVQALGYLFFFFSFHLPLVPLQPSVFALTNYPRAWLDLYRDRSYARIDPVTLRLKKAMYPFTWVADSSGPAAVRELYAEARTHGLNGGICVPFYGPRGTRAALTAAGGNVPPPGEALDRQYAGLLNFGLKVFSGITQNVAAQSNVSDPTELTARQQQILTGIAEGLSYYDIGERCGIKASTVKTLLDRCCQKLGVTTREQAIVMAMASGQIHPVAYPYPAAAQGRTMHAASFYVRPDPLAPASLKRA